MSALGVARLAKRQRSRRQPPLQEEKDDNERDRAEPREYHGQHGPRLRGGPPFLAARPQRPQASVAVVHAVEARGAGGAQGARQRMHTPTPGRSG